MAFMMMQPILFRHCDPAGIVFYPRYLEMVNDTVETWFDRVLDHSFATLHVKQGSSVPTVRLEAQFMAPSRLGDLLRLVLHPQPPGRSSLDLRLTGDCAGEMRLRAEVTLVHVAMADGRPAPWPEQLRGMLEQQA